MKKQEKTFGGMVVTIMAYTGIGILWVLTGLFKAMAYTITKAVKAMDHYLPEQMRNEVRGNYVPRANSVPVVTSREFHSTNEIAHSVAQPEQFEAADRIVTLRLNPPVAVINLQMFYKKKLIKREVIVNDQRLRSLLKGRRHVLSNVEYDPKVGLDEIKAQTVKLVEDLINTKGNQRVKTKVTKATIADHKAKTAQAAAPMVREVPQQAAKPVEVQAPKPVAPALPTPPAQVQNKVFVPRPATGVTFEGILMSAGNQRYTPAGREPYETFEVKVRTASGVDIPLTGIELEREFSRVNVKIGEKIAITPMGKVPVTLANGAESKKNVYRVERV